MGDVVLLKCANYKQYSSSTDKVFAPTCGCVACKQAHIKYKKALEVVKKRAQEMDW